MNKRELSKKAFYNIISLYLMVGFAEIAILARYWANNPLSYSDVIIVGFMMSAAGVFLMYIKGKLSFISSTAGYFLVTTVIAAALSFIAMPIGTIFWMLSGMTLMSMMFMNFANASPILASVIPFLYLSPFAWIERNRVFAQILKKGWVSEILLLLALTLFLVYVFWSCRKAKRTSINAIRGAFGFHLLSLIGVKE